MPAPENETDLDLLLATEQRLERALADARTEGEHLRASATAEAARADALAEAALEGERRRVSEQLAEEQAARIATIEADARTAVEGWDALRDQALERTARRLAQRLVQLAVEEP